MNDTLHTRHKSKQSCLKISFKLVACGVVVALFVINSFMIWYSARDLHGAYVEVKRSALASNLFHPSGLLATNDAMEIHDPHSRSRKICKDTEQLFTSRTAIDHVYRAEEAFHNRGGNLQATEHYLNSNIDKTLRGFNVEFIPEGEDKPLNRHESIEKHIRSTMKKKDIYKRGGYDQRNLPGQYKPDPKNAGGKHTKVVNNIRIDVNEPTQNGERWEFSMGPEIESLCKNIDNISGSKQSFEDKFMCGLDVLRNALEETENGTCNIISIGSNGEWGFERFFTENTKCHVHTFDCTVSEEMMQKTKPKTVHIYPYCVSHEDKEIDGRQYLTYGSIAKKMNLTQAPDMFKIDVEGFEYDFFSQMLNDESVAHLLPNQISVELHYATRMYDLEWMVRQRQAGEITMFNGMMYNAGGYIPVVKKHIGPGCDSCLEVLYVRLFCD